MCTSPRLIVLSLSRTLHWLSMMNRSCFSVSQYCETSPNSGLRMQLRGKCALFRVSDTWQQNTRTIIPHAQSKESWCPSSNIIEENLGLDPEPLPEDDWESLFFRIIYCLHVQVCATMLQLIKYLTLHYMMSNVKNSLYVNCMLLKVTVKKLTCLHVCCSYGCVFITMLANETILSDHWFAAHKSEFLHWIWNFV